jgi:FG-GAP-like repeat
VRRARALLPRSAPATRRAEPATVTRRHDGDPRVVDVAPDVGLGLVTRTYGAVVFDYDGDGWPDIFLGRHDAPAFLFKNEQGVFRRMDALTFPRSDRHCAAAADLTGNGRLDLFCVVGGDSGHGPKHSGNELWLQQDDGTFVNAGEQPGLADPFGRGREVLLFDATGNGRIDALVGNVSPRSDGKPSPNRLFLNDGDARFRAAPEFGLDLEYSVGGAGKPGSPFGGGNWPMGRLAALDANGDGWTDVVMCAQRPGAPQLGVHLFHNDEGHGFRDVTTEVGLEGVAARDVAVADMTGDGQPDLVVVDAQGVSIYLNDGGKFHQEYGLAVEHGFRLAVADADGDGRNDVYIMRTNAQPGPDIADLLLLRNGDSLDFTALVLPTVEGTVRDDAVYAIDYDGDGRSEFLVLHGHSLNAAPIQLIGLR